MGVVPTTGNWEYYWVLKPKDYYGKKRAKPKTLSGGIKKGGVGKVKKMLGKWWLWDA